MPNTNRIDLRAAALLPLLVCLVGCAAAPAPTCEIEAERRVELEVDGAAFELVVAPGPAQALPARVDLHLEAAEPVAVVQLGAGAARLDAPLGIPQADGSVVVARAARLDLQLSGADVGARLRFVRLAPGPEPLRGTARLAFFAADGRAAACGAAPAVQARTL